jgi:REP element-mobilizing transposase RayT
MSTFGTRASRPPEADGTPAIQRTHKGWYSRGYIPHFDSPGMLQGITFRLADSLPAHIVKALAEDPEMMQDPVKRKRVEEYLNSGYGACHLRDPRIGGMVENALLYFDGSRYRQIAWIVMPNHVHTLIETFVGYPLPDVIQSWKSYTAKQANRVLERSGQFWAVDYFDRYIRDERHFIDSVNYIHNNPVKTGLVSAPEAWPFSSASHWNADVSSATCGQSPAILILRRPNA